LLRLRILAGLSLALTLIALGPQRAEAHARYARSEPAADAVVPTAPGQLQVWFTEEVATQGSSLQVVDSTGNRVDRGDSRVDLSDPDRKLMLVSLMPLADGVYTVNWQTVSGEDGDAADGSFRFGVGANTVLPPMPGAGPAPRLTIESATVSGHEVRLHVDVDGATLGQPMGADMEMAGGGMDHDQMAHGDDMPMAMAPGGMPQGHLHVYVDGTMMLMVYQPDVVLTGVPSGAHEVRIELSDNAHQDWNPPVMATTTVLVP
jgi:methionine-rich copper-binding protein CopC